jgi:hypothetical protein
MKINVIGDSLDQKTISNYSPFNVPGVFMERYIMTLRQAISITRAIIRGGT